ncbi:hypothetical protein Sme01_01980 [Sphaerisporangium melleum]|uniref:DUF3105 domain-containing protein n=1 Tax=Sphaerisporangium melleum TaxID=321316 RepID=A0A917R555_9ACTN|nr:DUF3105 domain-containing protein [Sphaerisporangium melleum]GGK88780.1 hypothetical protein GCM10007964_34310 [Sphaerisporangium melleum]GII67722.1 hypothetical protein Sme01_01980 [Sphaerisporangium melleum]
MAKERTQARREHLAQLRAAQKRKERRTAMLMWGVGGFVIVLVIGLVGFYVIRENNATSLGGVKTFAYKASQHTAAKVKYVEAPPVGGEHNPSWQRCGTYDAPINSENAVHSMEHGAVWITYRPDLPKAQVDKLKALVTSDYILLSPFPGLPAPVVVSSWNNQLVLQGVDDPRLPRYISKYKQNPKTTPEYGATCSGEGATDKLAADNPLPATAPSSAPSGSAEPSAMPTS